MKPYNPYQGPAPAAMGMMGQGLIEAGANIGRTMQRGYESLGQGISKGVSDAVSQYAQFKDDQAKFDAAKKMFKAFGGDLNENARKEIDGIFADTSMSVREKNALAPTLMQFLGASQQQAGRESVAKIMNQGRVDAAGTRRPTPMTGSSFGGVQNVEYYMNLPANSSQGNPAPLQSTQPQGSPMISADGSSVYDSRNGKWVRLDNNARTGEIVPDNYYDDPDNLMFDPNTRRVTR